MVRLSQYSAGLLVVALFSSAAWAEETSFTASVDRSEVGLGEQVRLIVSISASDHDQVK